MNGISKKILTIFVAVLLASTPLVTAFASAPDRGVTAGQNSSRDAEGTNKGQDKQSQNQGNKSGFNGNRQKDADSASSAKSQNYAKNINKNINKEKILNIEAIKTAISGLSDQTAKASLLALVTAYQTALDTLQKDLNSNAGTDTLKADLNAAESARSALLSALSSAGIEAAATKGNASGNKAGQNAHAPLNVDVLKSAIESIKNETTRASLLALFTAYQTAVDALNNALNSNADADALKAARAAVDSARSSLLSGLYSAGIKIALVLGNGSENKKGLNAGGQLDIDAINTAIAALTDEAAKASLLALVAAYQTAVENQKSDVYSNAGVDTLKADREAVKSAKAALLGALAAAGIQINDKQDDDQDEDKDESDTKTPDDQLNIEAIKTAIAGLSDQAAQTSLTALVTAYQAALDALKGAVGSNADEDTVKAYRQAVESAKTTLLGALSAAGIQINDGQDGDETETKTPDGQLDIEAIKTAIAGLSDQDVQTSLTALVTAYQAALDTLKDAVGSNADEDTLKTYRDAVELSKNNLLTALSGAGIALPSSSPSPVPSPSPTETSQPQAQGSTGFWTVVVTWFLNVFGA